MSEFRYVKIGDVINLVAVDKCRGEFFPHHGITFILGDYYYECLRICQESLRFGTRKESYEFARKVAKATMLPVIEVVNNVGVETLPLSRLGRRQWLAKS